MKSLLGIFLAALLLAGISFGQVTDTTQVTAAQDQSQEQPTQQKPAKKQQAPGYKKVYLGGYMSLTVGSYTRIGVYPLLGYKFTPKLSGGLKIGYEYVSDKRYASTYTSSNYGGSIFARYRIIPRLYAHIEYEQFSYELYNYDGTSNREWIPFLYLGGGYSQPIGKNVWLTAQVLFDVLQDERSPYNAWDPIFSVGVAANF
jgi:hypothetical protein